MELQSISDLTIENLTDASVQSVVRHVFKQAYFHLILRLSTLMVQRLTRSSRAAWRLASPLVA